MEGAPTRTRSIGVGYVPQRHEFAWDFPIAVEDVVMTGRDPMLGAWRRPGVADWQAVDRALDLVRMSDLRRRTVGELSGGQRQRVLIARALALESPVLFLDEPFTGLDLPTQEILTELFEDLAADSRALVMTTHDIAGALDACTRVVLINGRIIADAPPEALRHREPWMQAFGVGERNPLLRVVEVA